MMLITWTPLLMLEVSFSINVHSVTSDHFLQAKSPLVSLPPPSSPSGPGQPPSFSPPQSPARCKHTKILFFLHERREP